MFAGKAPLFALAAATGLSGCGERNGAEALARRLLEAHRDSSMARQDTEARFGKTFVVTFRTRHSPDAILEDTQSRCRASDWRPTVAERAITCHRMGGSLSVEIDAERAGWSRVTVMATDD